MYQQSYRRQEYIEQDVMGASPARLIVMTYDLAIKACRQQNFEKAVQVVTVLRDTLNFEYKDVSAGLFRLYQWILDCIRAGDYHSALQTLIELRNAWAQAEAQMVARTQRVEQNWMAQPSVQPAY